MRKKLIQLLHFLKSVYVSDSRTINTCSLINDEILKGYADTIEKILSNNVILVDKNKLEQKFKDVPDSFNGFCLVYKKDFTLHSQVRISPFQYQANGDKKDFQEHIDKMLTNKLLEYFIDEVGVKGEEEDEQTIRI